uniref:F-box and WD repeat domain containing 5 n=1 Tax=Astyanax mexicanus TaxID=7994 RepID=A0A8B9HPQ7_ASTMX
MENGPGLPDSLVLEIFLHLPHAAVLRAGLACRQWFAVSRDEFLWRELFYSYYRIPRTVPRHPAAVSWYREFKRLYDCIPCVEVQTLREHHDQVLHLAFSHRGHRFSSCSKDCTVKVRFFSVFSMMLLIVYFMVFLLPKVSFLYNYTLLSRVRNKPYDVFGCWLNETHLISGNLHWIGNMTSCTVLWLNKAFQDIESENVNVVKRLFKIQNINASTIRTVMVAHCRRHDTPDLLLDYEAQSQARAQAQQHGNTQQHQPMLFDLGASDSEEEGHEEDEDEERGEGRCSAYVPHFSAHDRELEARVARMMGSRRTKAPDPSLVTPSAPGEGDDKTYLLFTTGSLTYSPHQIGIKRIMPDQMTTCGPVLGEERSSEEFFDSLDHVIDIHGHIIGMGLSPDHRYLYVNSRAWPAGCIISDPMSPPPIAEEIDLHVIDLKSLREERRSLRAHRAFTPNDECFFIFLDVSRDFVASGAEDKHGYIWDRHYNICLARLQHDDVVNSVAFSPADQELLLSASDDSTIKVWRSPRMVRLAQSPPRPARPRSILSSLLARRHANANSAANSVNGKP